MNDENTLDENTLSITKESFYDFPEIDMTTTIDDRFVKAKEYVLVSLRKASGRGKMAPISDILVHFGVTLPEKPSQSEITQYEKFCQEIYPALDRLKDLRARAIESLHAKILTPQKTSDLTALVKILNGDIDDIENGGRGKNGSPTFNIQINTEEFNNILSSYQAKKIVKDDVKIIDGETTN